MWCVANWTFSVATLPATFVMLHRLVGDAGFVAVTVMLASQLVSWRFAAVVRRVVRALQARRDAGWDQAWD